MKELSLSAILEELYIVAYTDSILGQKNDKERVAQAEQLILALNTRQPMILSERKLLDVLYSYKSCKGLSLEEIFQLHCETPQGEMIDLSKHIHDQWRKKCEVLE